MNAAEWTELRDRLRGDAVIAALGIDPADAACPSCRSRVDVCHDPSYGTSLRCVRERCRFGSWAWPEYFARDLWGAATLADATVRLLAAVDEIERFTESDRARRHSRRHREAIDKLERLLTVGD